MFYESYIRNSFKHNLKLFRQQNHRLMQPVYKHNSLGVYTKFCLFYLVGYKAGILCSVIIN